MHKNCSNTHVNAFIVSNGIPNLVGEYVDGAVINTIDRGLIKDEIIVDTTESMRPVIDISIDTIGKNASDGLPSIIGNTTRYNNLLELIKKTMSKLDAKFPVIKPGIVVRVYYQLENRRTGQVIRSMVEDLRIRNRQYFLDINKDDINDNAIITHFTDSMMSTVNHFTHGPDQMILRITSIQLCYEVACDDVTAPRLQGTNPGAILASVYEPQHAGLNAYVSPNWYLFSRFYHFEESCKDIILHDQEIHDVHNKILRIECGKIQVNRFFAINPGSRIVFKFSIWQNDVILVNDTSEIASALGIGIKPTPYPYPPYTPTPTPPPCPYNPWDQELKRMMDRVMEITRRMHNMDMRQNGAVNQISSAVKELISEIREISGKTDPTPELPDDLPTGGDRPHPHPHPHPPKPWDQIRRIEKMLVAIQAQLSYVKDLAEEEASEPNVVPLSDEDINAAVDEADHIVPYENSYGDDYTDYGGIDNSTDSTDYSGMNDYTDSTDYDGMDNYTDQTI